MRELLVIRRSQPSEGQEVYTSFEVEGRAIGAVNFPFKLWVMFNSLLKRGMELDMRENNAAGLKVKVEGYIVPKPGPIVGTVLIDAPSESIAPRVGNPGGPMLGTVIAEEDKELDEAVKRMEWESILVKEEPSASDEPSSGDK